MTYLIESWKNVVSKLYLCDGIDAEIRKSYTKTGNSLFTKRRVEHPTFSKLLLQSYRATKNTAKRYVLAKNDWEISNKKIFFFSSNHKYII